MEGGNREIANTDKLQQKEKKKEKKKEKIHSFIPAAIA
jgi:hypothetical protein